MTVAEAARALGISSGAVRKRIERGQLPAAKVDGFWRVDLLGATAARLEATASHDSTRPGHDSAGADVIAELRADVAFLRQALEREQLAHSEARRLLAGAQQQITELVRALPAPQEMPPTRPERRESGPETVELVQTPPEPESLAQALKDAGVEGKKTRRRLLARLAAAWRGE